MISLTDQRGNKAQNKLLSEAKYEPEVDVRMVSLVKQIQDPIQAYAQLFKSCTGLSTCELLHALNTLLKNSPTCSDEPSMSFILPQSTAICTEAHLVSTSNGLSLTAFMQKEEGNMEEEAAIFSLKQKQLNNMCPFGKSDQ